jgi:signal transduction histidine kinase
LENLVSNALVHGPAGGKVSVALRRRGPVAELSVRDEGPGPGAHYSARVFERFWRAPEASDRPGSGLGLSIVSAIVDRHGGQISVDGATFTVSLPIADPAFSSSS